MKKAEDGQKVVVKLTEWPERAQSPFGEYKGISQRVLTKIMMELFQTIKTSFVESIPKEIIEKYKLISKDAALRKETLSFTIDPKTAKDFDDALSFKVLDKDRFEIGIHIADVSHYVKPHSILDQEAHDRATSVYLVDRVVPMLPESLSNNLCSLRPNEEKLTFSVIFTFNSNYEVKNYWFGRTVINSNQRFSYKEAQHIIDNKSNIIPKEISLSNKEYKIGNEIEGIQIDVTVEDSIKIVESGKAILIGNEKNEPEKDN